MFDRMLINTDKQFFGICIPFSYIKAITAIHNIPNKYIDLMIEYINEYNPRLTGLIDNSTDKLLIQKLVENIGIEMAIYMKAQNPSFDINYNFLITDVSKKIHKAFHVNLIKDKCDIKKVINDPSNSILASEPNLLLNLAFKHCITIDGQSRYEHHSIIVGFDNSGLYIVDPNIDGPYPFENIYCIYHVVELGECIVISKVI